MKNNRFTSAADRRWQRRYKTIIQRKEDDRDYNEQKKQRKILRQLGYKNDVELNFSCLEKNYLPAVLCTTKEKARHLFREVRRQGLHYSWHYEDDRWEAYKERTVYIFARLQLGSQDIIYADIRMAQNARCTIIPYEDLLPPPDYGEICNISELSMLFGG